MRVGFYLRRMARLFGLMTAPLIFLISLIMRSVPARRFALKLDPDYIRALPHPTCQERRVAAFHRKLICAGKISAELDDGRFDDLVRSQLAASQAQLMQDIVALYYCGERFKSFIEIGVGDGVRLSNSHLLEAMHGWKGVLVEPAKHSAEKIRSRRSATLIEAAIIPEHAETLFFEEVIDKPEFSALSGRRDRRTESDATLVYPVRGLLAEEFGRQYLPQCKGYLSIDIEGGEDLLLEKLIPDLCAKFVTIEHNYEPSVESNIISLMTKSGYRNVHRAASGFDVWFVRTISE